MAMQGFKQFQFGLGDIELQPCNVPELKEDNATND